MKKQTKCKMLMCGSAGILLSMWLIWGNTSLQVDRYTVYDSRIPEAFSGFRIAQISDLHNASLGPGNKRLLNQLALEAPDVILITGDLVDSRRTDADVACAFVREASKLAPVYYVPGNHESRLDYAALREEIRNAGAAVLDNEKCLLQRDGQYITLLGLMDPQFSSEEEVGASLRQLMKEEQNYTILMSHRPELMDVYAQAQVCLVFSGHAHGGQIRIPFIGGLYVPNQGLFPKYDSGLCRQEDTQMLVSRGLGDSIIPLRVNNRRSLLIADLVSGQGV